MPKFVIEREIPGAGSLSPEESKNVVQNSLSVLNELGPKIQWQHSYIAQDKIYCLYIAPSEGLILEHAKRSGLPANVINKVVGIADPTSAE